MLIEYLDQVIKDEQEKEKTTKDIHHPVLRSSMLVMGYEDTDDNNKDSITIALNIPGGKRRLGENSQHGAIRELEEETSIILTHKQYKTYSMRKREINMFFEFKLN